GTFSAASCALVSDGSPTTFTSSCQVDYTPTAGEGTHTVTAAYQGKIRRATSRESVDLTVTKRTTKADLSCQTPRAIDQASTCTVTVTDTDSGANSDRRRSFSFGRSGLGAGTFSAASCALVSDGSPTTFTSSCQVDYTPTAGEGTHTVTAAYQG